MIRALSKISPNLVIFPYLTSRSRVNLDSGPKMQSLAQINGRIMRFIELLGVGMEERGREREEIIFTKR